MRLQLPALIFIAKLVLSQGIFETLGTLPHPQIADFPGLEAPRNDKFSCFQTVILSAAKDPLRLEAAILLRGILSGPLEPFLGIARCESVYRRGGRVECWGSFATLRMTF